MKGNVATKIAVGRGGWKFVRKSIGDAKKSDEPFVERCDVWFFSCDVLGEIFYYQISCWGERVTIPKTYQKVAFREGSMLPKSPVAEKKRERRKPLLPKSLTARLRRDCRQPREMNGSKTRRVRRNFEWYEFGFFSCNMTKILQFSNPHDFLLLFLWEGRNEWIWDGTIEREFGNDAHIMETPCQVYTQTQLPLDPDGSKRSPGDSVGGRFER